MSETTTRAARATEVVTVLCAVAFVLGFAASAQAVQQVSRAEVQQWLESSRDGVPDFAPGEVLTDADLERLHPFVVPGYLEELNFPGFQMQIAAAGDYTPHPLYQNATLQYAGQSELAPDGALLNYVAGQPFPNKALDAASPDQAGLMAAWNSNFRWQHYGQHVIDARTLFLKQGSGVQTQFDGFPPEMITGGGVVERSMEMGWRRTYMNHLPQLADTDHGFEFAAARGATFKEVTEYYSPFEFRGQKLMVERPLDPHEDDTINAYLPGERKVRRLSAKEKSDTWLGSEITLDDFYGFDGHVLDNTWNYLGRRKILVVMDSKHSYPHFIGPHSRVLDDRWELREAIVAEGIPTLSGHPYGSRLLFLDTQNYRILAALYFDPDRTLLRGMIPIYSWSETTKDNPELNRGAHVSMYKGNAYINFQTGNATLTNVVETAYPGVESKKVRRMYSVDQLSQGR